MLDTCDLQALCGTAWNTGIIYKLVKLYCAKRKPYVSLIIRSATVFSGTKLIYNLWQSDDCSMIKQIKILSV